jgi:hypothetical protein
MISIARLFLIDEIGPILGPPFRNSIGSTVGQPVQTGRVNPTATEKVENIRMRQRSVPTPKSVDLGMKPFKTPPSNIT